MVWSSQVKNVYLLKVTRVSVMHGIQPHGLIIASAQLMHMILSMRINYEFATTDHVPFSMSINLGNLQTLLSMSNNMQVGKLDWSNLTEEELKVYCFQSDMLLRNIDLPKDAAICCDINCKNPQHGIELCFLYDNIVESLLTSGRSLHKTKMYNSKPGWNEYVREFHAEARKAFKAWVESGRQNHGPLFEYKKQTNANFKYALGFIKRNENIMRPDCEETAK